MRTHALASTLPPPRPRLSRAHLRSGLLLALLGGALVAATGCDTADADGNTFDAAAYAGTYDGTVTSALTNGGQTVTTTAPLTLTVATSGTATAGTFTVTFDAGAATEGGDDPAPVTLPGTYTATGARFVIPGGSGSGLTVSIDGDGDIGGGGVFQFFDVGLSFTADGRLTTSALNLDLDGEVTEGNPDVPEGADALITIRTTRAGS